MYKDDDLIYIPNNSGSKTSNLQKKIIQEFKIFRFKI